MMHEEKTLLMAEQYLGEEISKDHKDEIAYLINQKNEEGILDLKDRMTFLQFGTAGLRAKMGAGYNRMNIVSVYRFAFALTKENIAAKSIVIGFDGRKMSQAFGLEVARVLSGYAEVYIFNHVVPTPLLAYATKKLSAYLGIMITASHNQACDNGIKLFLSSSAQAHGDILKNIQLNMALAPMRNNITINKSSNILLIEDSIINDYITDLSSTKFFPNNKFIHPPIVYTPLHGVGKDVFLKAMNNESRSEIILVKSQSEPNEKFPTILFPNPEEEHTLDLAHELAHEKNIDWVFANDPDADRLQVSVRDEKGDYKKLTGNEIGAIFTYFSINQTKERKPLIASSIVSSRLTMAICQKLQAYYVDSLTGFSNIIERALKFEAKNDCNLVFAYEEAIGFLIGKVVLDKDGIHAALRFMEIIGHLNSMKKSVFSFMDYLYLNFGLFIDKQWYIRFADLNYNKKNKIMKMFRETNPHNILPNSNIFDLTSYNHKYSDLKADVLIFESEEARFIVRPSGTEPKIKFYLEFYNSVTENNILAQKLFLKQKIIDRYTIIKDLTGE